ncbi:MAG: GGDEF domain-containing protein, partial [Deltaproteobacteria bacterium]|nr:GGDEF domain-containing protein [Deltaproteobacteria bacterium]
MGGTYLLQSSWPYLLVGIILLWTGFFFLIFSFYLRKRSKQFLLHLFFSLSCLSIGGFSLSSSIIYPAYEEDFIIQWSHYHWIFGILTSVFAMIFFSQLLKIHQKYFLYYYPLVGLICLATFPLKGALVTGEVHFYFLKFFEKPLIQSHATPGLAPLVSISWAVIHGFYLSFFWLRHRKKDPYSFSAFFLFFFIGIYEALISFGIYQGISLLSFSSAGLLLYMAFRLFKDLSYVFLEKGKSSVVSHTLKHLKTNLERSLKLVSQDTLTQIPNRRAFQEKLSSMELDFPKFLPEAQLFLIELEGLSKINEEHGHSIGNDLLKLFSESLVNLDSDTEKTFRLSGNSFAKLCQNPSKNRKYSLAKQLENILNEIKRDSLYEKVKVHLGCASLKEVKKKKKKL